MTRIKLALLALLTLVGIGCLSNQASATANDCIDGNDKYSYTVSFTRGSGTITTKNGRPLCQSTKVTLQSFTMPATWDGNLTFNKTAIPQYKFAAVELMIPANVRNYSKTLSIAVPDVCYPTQLDWYVGGELDAIINFHDGEDREVPEGKIFAPTGTCKPPEAKKIEACELATKKIVWVEKTKLDPATYTTDLQKCAVVPPVPVQVCDTASKTIVWVKPDQIAGGTYTKDLTKCQTPTPKKVQVCELASKSIVWIDENKVSASYTTDLARCNAAPAAPTTPQVSSAVTTTPSVLPNTGTGALLGLFGLTSVLGAALHQVVVRLRS